MEAARKLQEATHRRVSNLKQQAVDVARRAYDGGAARHFEETRAVYELHAEVPRMDVSAGNSHEEDIFRGKVALRISGQCVPRNEFVSTVCGVRGEPLEELHPNAGEQLFALSFHPPPGANVEWSYGVPKRLLAIRGHSPSGIVPMVRRNEEKAAPKDPRSKPRAAAKLWEKYEMEAADEHERSAGAAIVECLVTDPVPMLFAVLAATPEQLRDGVTFEAGFSVLRGSLAPASRSWTIRAVPLLACEGFNPEPLSWSFVPQYAEDSNPGVVAMFASDSYRDAWGQTKASVQVGGAPVELNLASVRPDEALPDLTLAVDNPIGLPLRVSGGKLGEDGREIRVAAASSGRARLTIRIPKSDRGFDPGAVTISNPWLASAKCLVYDGAVAVDEKAPPPLRRGLFPIMELNPVAEPLPSSDLYHTRQEFIAGITHCIAEGAIEAPAKLPERRIAWAQGTRLFFALKQTTTPWNTQARQTAPAIEYTIRLRDAAGAVFSHREIATNGKERDVGMPVAMNGSPAKYGVYIPTACIPKHVRTVIVEARLHNADATDYAVRTEWNPVAKLVVTLHDADVDQLSALYIGNWRLTTNDKGELEFSHRGLEGSPWRVVQRLQPPT